MRIANWLCFKNTPVMFPWLVKMSGTNIWGILGSDNEVIWPASSTGLVASSWYSLVGTLSSGPK